jgi:hypothetical protein
MSQVLRLTDAQLDAVLRAAQPLAPADRGAFLEALAQALAGYQEIGDGQLYVVIREVQRRHFDPPRNTGMVPHPHRSREP